MWPVFAWEWFLLVRVYACVCVHVISVCLLDLRGIKVCTVILVTGLNLWFCPYFHHRLQHTLHQRQVWRITTNAQDKQKIIHHPEVKNVLKYYTPKSSLVLSSLSISGLIHYSIQVNTLSGLHYQLQIFHENGFLNNCITSSLLTLMD